MNYTAAQMSQPATHRINRRRRILAVAFVASFAFDFKGAVGGSPIQFLMITLNTAAFLILAASYRLLVPRKGLSAFVFWGWIAFLLTGTLGAFYNATPAAHFVRIIYPFTLFLEGFLVAWWTTKDPRDAKTIVAAMMATAVVSLFFTFWWGFYFTDQSTDQIRYQILTPLTPLLLVIAGYDLLFARRQKMRSIILLTIVIGAIALSVTRGQILIILFVALAILLAALWNAKHTSTLPRPITRAVAWSWILIGVGIAAAYFFNPNVLARWMHRVLGATQDVTFWTRVAAVVGQYQALTTSHLGWLIGKGFGSRYSWPMSEFPWIIKYVGVNGFGSTAWFPGEFMWMTFLFYGGFIIGPITALVLLSGAARAFQLLRALLRAQSWRISKTRSLWVGVLGYFAFLGMGFTANPYILRPAAMFMGLCLGIVVAQGRPSLILRNGE